MRKLLASVLITTSSLGSTSAMAWGAYEQGIVTGIAGTIITQQLIRPIVPV